MKLQESPRTSEQNTLVESFNRKLLGAVVNPLKELNPWIDIEDLEQEALLGVLAAAQRWDESKETKFTTYASVLAYRNALRYCKAEAKVRSRFQHAKSEDRPIDPADYRGQPAWEELAELLPEVFASLTLLQRHLLEVRFCEEPHSWEAIEFLTCKEFGLSIPDLQKQLFIAVQAIADRLGHPIDKEQFMANSADTKKVGKSCCQRCPYEGKRLVTRRGGLVVCKKCNDFMESRKSKRKTAKVT